jgi:peptide/nickel transport system substrate-binding protein
VQELKKCPNRVATVKHINKPSPKKTPKHKIPTPKNQPNPQQDTAGWVRGRDGVREKGGRRLKLVFQTSINPVRQKVQSIYKQACGKAGIELELKAVTAAVFFSSDVANPDTYGKFWADLQMYASANRDPDPDRYMQQWVSWEASSKANKWLGVNRGRWFSNEYDTLYKASEEELDPVRRAALMIRMNDLVCTDHAVIPVVYRLSVAGAANNLVLPSSGWDLSLAGIADWYRNQ